VRVLSAIVSRSKAEVEANLEGLLPTFAKPGRSWWEAKSGKNLIIVEVSFVIVL
jgi:hypothetical protein